jgi:NAD(P)-dependent dehydrogenase (short-subunit alcohol dehydrogenase family)/peroxiredoxin
LRDRIDDIRAAGAELVIVGNGSAFFAGAFREDLALDCPLLVDPELRAYRAAGLRRGRVEILSPRLPLNALRALGAGYRQKDVQGDAWQLGGVFVIRPDRSLAYRYVSREAGDHPPVEQIIAALAPGAPPVDEQAPASPLRSLAGRGLGLLVDPTIFLSFDHTGFLIHSLTFDPNDLDVDLADRRCLITGANTGLGFEVALGLADLGAEVVLLCRSQKRGEEAADRIREQTGNRRVSVEIVDMSSLQSIRNAAPRLAAKPVSVLVHNAGLLPPKREETKDGLELTFATHVVGPHLLTHLLTDALGAAPDARVVWVSSGGMYTQQLNLDDTDWTAREYDGVTAYAETKRAQVVLSELWAKKLRRRGITVNAMHPGWADTPGVRSSIPTFHRITKAILRSPAEGADTVVWLAASERAKESTGQFFFDRQPRWTHLLPHTGETEGERRKLWKICERLSPPAPAKTL